MMLTSKDLAKRWGVQPSTITQMRYRGEGPGFIKVGRSCLYRLEDVEQYEEDNYHTPGEKNAE